MSETPYLLTKVAECDRCHHECHCDDDLHADEYGICTCERCHHKELVSKEVVERLNPIIGKYFS